MQRCDHSHQSHVLSNFHVPYMLYTFEKKVFCFLRNSIDRLIIFCEAILQATSVMCTDDLLLGFP